MDSKVLIVYETLNNESRLLSVTMHFTMKNTNNFFIVYLFPGKVKIVEKKNQSRQPQRRMTREWKMNKTDLINKLNSNKMKIDSTIACHSNSIFHWNS